MMPSKKKIYQATAPMEWIDYTNSIYRQAIERATKFQFERQAKKTKTIMKRLES
jgi:hypothetical protein